MKTDRGGFRLLQREQLLQELVRPTQRIMAIAADGEGVLVTTTDAHLARRMGDALYKAYKGELDYRYNDEDNLLRVLWCR